MKLFVVSVPGGKGAFLVAAATTFEAIDHVRYCKEWSTLEQYRLADRLQAVDLNVRVPDREERIIATLKGGDVSLC